MRERVWKKNQAKVFVTYIGEKYFSNSHGEIVHQKYTTAERERELATVLGLDKIKRVFVFCDQ